MNVRLHVCPSDYYDLLRVTPRPAPQPASLNLHQRLAGAIGIPLEPARTIMAKRLRELEEMLLTTVPCGYERLHDVGRPPQVHNELRNDGYVVEIWAAPRGRKKLAKIVGHSPYLGRVHRIGRVVGSPVMYPPELLNAWGEKLTLYEELTTSMAPNMAGMQAEKALAVIIATAAAITA